MFGKWFEEYQKLSQKTRFISQLGAFLIALFAMLSLYDWLQIYISYPNIVNEYRLMSDVFIKSLIFQVLIGLIFFARFVLLFSKSDKMNWVKVALYLIGLGLLVSYNLISPRLPYNPDIAHHDTDIFKFASTSFNIIAVFYLVLSPFIKFCLGALALSKSK